MRQPGALLWVAGAAAVLLVIMALVFIAGGRTHGEHHRPALKMAQVEALIRNVAGPNLAGVQRAEAALERARGPIVRAIETKLGDAASPATRTRLHRVLRTIQQRYYPGALVSVHIDQKNFEDANLTLFHATHYRWQTESLFDACHFASSTTAGTFSLDATRLPVLLEFWRLQRMALRAAEAKPGSIKPKFEASTTPGGEDKQPWSARCPIYFDGAFAFVLNGVKFNENQQFWKGWAAPRRSMQVSVTLLIDPSARVSFSTRRAGYLTDIEDGTGHSLLPAGTVAIAHCSSPAVGSGHVLWGTPITGITFTAPAHPPSDGSISQVRGYLPAQIWMPQRITITRPQLPGQRFQLRNGDTFIYEGTQGEECHFVLKLNHLSSLNGIRESKGALAVSRRLVSHARIDGRDSSGHRVVAGFVMDKARGSRARITEEIFRPSVMATAPPPMIAPPPAPVLPLHQMVFTFYTTARWCELPFCFKNLKMPALHRNVAPPKLPPQAGLQRHHGSIWTCAYHSSSNHGTIWRLDFLMFSQRARYALRQPLTQRLIAQLSVRPSAESATFDVNNMQPTSFLSAFTKSGMRKFVPALRDLSDGNADLLPRRRPGGLLSLGMVGPKDVRVNLMVGASPPKGRIAAFRGHFPLSFLGTSHTLAPIPFAPGGRWSKPIAIDANLQVRVRMLRTHFIGANSFDRLIDINFIPAHNTRDDKTPSDNAAFVEARFLSGIATIRDGHGHIWGRGQLQPESYAAATGSYRGKVWVPPPLPHGAVRQLVNGGSGPERGQKPKSIIFNFYGKSRTVRSVFDFRNIPWQPLN